jgi:hypothetical protein
MQWRVYTNEAGMQACPCRRGCGALRDAGTGRWAWLAQTQGGIGKG